MQSNALVVDANILVRAVLGRRVREVIETYAGDVPFFVPDSAYAEAEEHLAVYIWRDGRVVELSPDEAHGASGNSHGK